MCGRFASYKNLNKLKDIFKFYNSDFKISPSYNISPGQDVNIIINYKHENYFLHSNWGYNFINKNTQNKQAVINVMKRGDTRSTIDPCQNIITAEARVASV